MRSNLKLGIGLIGLLCVLVLGVIAFANTNVSPNTSATEPAVNGVATQATLSKALVTTLTASTLSATDEVAVGQAYNRPYSLPPLHIKVVRAANPPLITQQTALQVLYNYFGKTQWLLGKGDIKSDTGEPITVEATYGLVTEGVAGPNGSWGGGDANIHLAKCTIEGVCTFTGEILDHFENRPMWVLVYTGIHEDTHGGISPECRAQPTVTPCPTVGLGPNHHVYLVDAQTLQFFDGSWY